jgi:phage protein D
MPPANPSQRQFYASRPTIKIDGEEQRELSESLLQSLLIEETTLGLFRCEARFANWGAHANAERVDFYLFDGQIVDFGKEIEIELGPPGGTRRVFKGRITGLEAHYAKERPPELTVLAEDRFQDLRMERRTRTFEDSSDADAMRAIIAQHGLTADIDVDGPTHRVLAQVNQSDLAFLRERAAAVDAELWLDDRTVHVQARARRDAGSITLTYGAGLLELTVMADLAHQRSAVKVSGWDVAGKQAIDVEAGESAVSAELASRRSGGGVLGLVLAERAERVGLATPLSQAEAQALADARYRRRARRFLTGAGVADGNPAIQVGGTLEARGVGPLFEGAYYVTQVRHTFDLVNGYRTTFEVERPGLGG